MDNTPENKGTLEKTTKSSFISSFYDYFEIICFSLIAVLLLFSFCLRLCRVDGRSMNNTLYHGENLIISDLFYEPTQGDIVVFHLCNDYYSEPLVKRVIATEGQTVRIDFNTGDVKVDGTLIEEGYIFVDSGSYTMRGDFNPEFTDFENKIFEATVPKGHIFVMGDNRNNSSDSRSYLVGFVDENTVLGRALARVSPFTVFK